ncbi:MAG: hypothetical protein K0S72_2116, partial [Arthrobacter sp.]|nr:hypothetical protein [Arthrobacter sp.]
MLRCGFGLGCLAPGATGATGGAGGPGRPGRADRGNDPEQYDHGGN